jgi:hypothetical protein
VVTYKALDQDRERMTPMLGDKTDEVENGVHLSSYVCKQEILLWTGKEFSRDSDQFPIHGDTCSQLP